MSTWSMRRAARKLADSATARLSGPVPSRRLCEELCRTMSELRGGRPVELSFVEFPPDTATGLVLVHEDHDRILVDRRTTGVQQVVVTGHELRHLTQPDHHRYVDGAAAAARLLSEADDPERAWNEVLHAAARSHSQDPCERDAENFGLTLGGRLLPWVAGDAQDSDPGPYDGLLGRIQTSLGPR
ncbi:MAG TPA: toxin-antitoxin system, toxin component [Streptomyces sp.]|uniref:toxin-antitoxin system, toxin component n=1 Tax=Streptomyces sp. TaxID=1931 RepID=UPI002D2E8A93|nr:toxin-antitoxin system, toxin component [Streptomyces sp.]HZG07268.1 toxin-antitoxin system, toxin component [Streptomyces sp.]